ncbi:MAG: hypothetical protein Kow0075_07560 [Salibacteraceae bacterium]
MKKTLLSTAAILCFGLVNAQTIVSTSVEKRAPVLEEFTGVNCVYCPDGHRIAQDLKETISNSVLINIHAGGYAPTNPPFRTPFNEPIDDQSGVAGYPAGTVNRDNSIAGVTYQTSGGSAMSRGYFGTAFSQVATENTPVNVAIDASFNETTMELTLLVEVYYTGTTDSVDYLNIGLLQSNVKGPQTGAELFYPEMMYADGDYNHNHMLRNLLTGQWGWELYPTGPGFFWDTTITYTLPSTLYGLATSWKDMEVFAFVADTHHDIFTGVSQWLYPESDFWDLSTTTSNTSADGFCASSTDVEVEVTNDGNEAITAFDLRYAVNGGTVQTESFSGTLSPGASTTVSLSVNLSPGVNSIVFEKLSNVKGSSGQDLYNPTAKAFLEKPDDITIVSVEDGADPLFTEDFEDETVGDWPSDLYVYQTLGTYPIVLNQNYASWITNPVGGHGKSEQSLWFPLGYSSVAVGSVHSVITDNFDFSKLHDPVLKYSYAYSSLTASDNSVVKVELSKDCGVTWKTIYSKIGSEINTAGVNGTNIVIPSADQWDDVEIDLKDYSGQAQVMFKFSITKGNTNTYYIDDINVNGYVETEVDGQTVYILDGDTFELHGDEYWPLSVEEMASSNIAVYPNPSAGVVTVQGATPNTTVSVFDLRGRLVYSQTLVGNTVDLSNLETGIYTLVLNQEEGQHTVRLNIVR